MQKVFANGNGMDRPILIDITDNVASFYFKKDYDQHFEWLYNQKENDIEVEPEHEKPSEFYWIPKDRWEHPQENYPQHMERKNWFTEEMMDYLNDNL